MDQHYGEKPTAPPPYSPQMPQGSHPGPPGFHPPPAAYPHPAPYPPPPVIRTTTVYPGAVTVVSAVTVTPMGTESSTTVCKSCNQQITTKVKHIATTKTHLFALLLCLVGCWPCACIPYCMDSCKTTDHYCPNCEAYVGSYLR